MYINITATKDALLMTKYWAINLKTEKIHLLKTAHQNAKSLCQTS